MFKRMMSGFSRKKPPVSKALLKSWTKFSKYVDHLCENINDNPRNPANQTITMKRPEIAKSL
jgi:hypothetical protein